MPEDAVVETPVPEPVPTEPVVEATPEPEPTPPPNKPVMVPVAVVADLREKKRGLESTLEQRDKELAEARAMLERMQRGDKPGEPQQTYAPPRAVPQQQQPTDDVERAAAALVVNRDIARVNDTGMRAYAGQWNDTVSALTAFGVNTPDFLVDVIEIDPANAHKIMHDIAQDGERAVALANMSKARRIAEIAKMTMSAEPVRAPDGKFAPKELPKQVSKAPAPPPPVTPSASKEIDWRTDDASDEDFSRGFDEMMKKRSNRR